MTHKILLLMAALIFSNAMAAHAFQERPNNRFRTHPKLTNTPRPSPYVTKTIIVNGPTYVYHEGRYYRLNNCDSFNYLT